MVEDIKQIIKSTLESMGVAYEEIVISTGAGGVTRFCVRTNESGVLIGHGGQNFLALNHVIKKMAAKRFPDAQFSFDINDYQNQNAESIKNKAMLLAERARSFQTNIEMEPMSSYERMIVHSTLSETPDIETESSGSGENRRVVIKYVKTEI